MGLVKKPIDIRLIWHGVVAQGAILLAPILIGLVWAGVHFHVQSERDSTERAAILNAANLAGAFEEHLSRSLNEVDRSLRIIRAAYSRDPRGFDLSKLLKSTPLFDDQVLQVSIIGRDGFIKLSSVDSASSVGTDLRDREHFRHHLNAKGDELFVSKPVIGRLTGKWSIQLTRRIAGEDGSFAGVVVASFDPAYLTRFYSSVDTGTDGYVRVFGIDGVVRAMGGRSTTSTGSDMSMSSLFKHYPQASSGWYYIDSTLTDHVPRLITYRALKNYPLIITIGLSTREIFAHLDTERSRYYLVAAALTALILLVMAFGIRGRLLRERTRQEIVHLAHHDSLTGLPNRIRLSERLDDALAGVDCGAQLAVLLLDLDLFKNVNDTFGHLVGDELLEVVADRLRACTRATDTVARLGGDEFAIVQTAIESPAQIATLAERIREAIKAPYELAGLQAVIDVSIGISQAPGDGTTSAELIKRADLALYKAKGGGRGTYRFFEPEMDARMKARQALETDLRAAAAAGGGAFELLYQPVLASADGRIVGVEGLLRWHHPTRGTISPMEFIPVAEETGLIVPIGEWVIRQACADAAAWPDDIKIAVNLSPAQFNNRDLVSVITAALAASGVSPGRLEVEITEDMLLAHDQATLLALKELRELGIKIVLDDFGTGYSSLSYLRHFPVDRIKIDRTFISDLSDRNDPLFAIVETIARLARALQVPTTAEGVETAEQLELLRAAGCTHFQGYLFSPPRPASEIARLLPPRPEGKVQAA